LAASAFAAAPSHAKNNISNSCSVFFTVTMPSRVSGRSYSASHFPAYKSRQFIARIYFVATDVIGISMTMKFGSWTGKCHRLQLARNRRKS
jgi:hypothetical protein